MPSGALTYVTPQGAYQQGLAQLSIYRRWDAGAAPIRLATERGHLVAVLRTWPEDTGQEDAGAGGAEGRQVGLVLLIENADLIRVPDDVAFWHRRVCAWWVQPGTPTTTPAVA